VIAGLSLAGIFPLAGFWSKDAIVAATFVDHYYVLFGMALLTVFLTAFYIFRAIFVAFTGEPRTEGAREAVDPPGIMTGPMMILAFLAVASGWIGIPEGFGLGIRDYFAEFVEPGEFVQPGAPLYKIADLSTLTLRAYVGGGQLPELQIGQAVGVQVDGPGGELRTLQGRVVWIASEAEFTPTPIQTRDERADQVYAVKVRVPNADGLIKVGMPGELVLSTKAPGDRPLAARAPSGRDRGGR